MLVWNVSNTHFSMTYGYLCLPLTQKLRTNRKRWMDETMGKEGLVGGQGFR